LSRFGSRLSFQIIGGGTRLGYWAAGLVMSVAWVVGVPLVISEFGGNAYEWTNLVSMKGFVLCVLVLWGLLWIKKSSSGAIESLRRNVGLSVAPELEKGFMSVVAWRVGFAIDLILYGGWLFYFDNPITRWGIFPVLYNTLIWLPLSLIFVDLFALLSSILMVSRRVARHAEVDILHPDKCGGMRQYSRHVLKSSAVYYFVLSVATFARSEFLTASWVSVVAIMAWILGLVFVIGCLYHIGANIRLQKENALDACFRQLRELGGLTATTTEHAAKSLFLYRVIDQLEAVRVWPLDVRLMRDFLLSSVVPFLVSALLARLLSAIGVL
jgi:hypothetical protein